MNSDEIAKKLTDLAKEVAAPNTQEPKKVSFDLTIPGGTWSQMGFTRRDAAERLLVSFARVVLEQDRTVSERIRYAAMIKNLLEIQ